MTILAPADYRVMPWKNGAGTTTEIYRSRTTSSPFDWRVSIAQIDADGPFSPFLGYDRHIMAIEGSGMVLEGGPGGPLPVAPVYAVASFSGDWPIAARLLEGPVTNFNLVARRDVVRSALTCMKLTSPHVQAADNIRRLIYVLDGSVSINGHRLTAKHALVANPDEQLAFSPSGKTVRLAVCHIESLAA